ncbi:MAG: replicative DNA helicase [Giesbergeria sp.]
MATKTVVRAIDVAGRTPPHDADAETALVAACLTDWQADGGRPLDEARLVLAGPESLYDDACRRVWVALCELADAGTKPDPLTVADRLRVAGTLEAVGGLAWLNRLTMAPPIVSATRLAVVVERAARARRMIEAAQLVAADGYVSPDDGYVSRSMETLSAASTDTTTAETLESLGAISQRRIADMASWWKGDREAMGMRTGFGHLDAITGGLRLGEVTFIGAGTSVGKSLLAQQWAMTIAASTYNGEPCGVAYLTLEMPREDIWDRAMCHLARVRLVELHTGRTVLPTGGLGNALDDEACQRIHDAGEAVNELPFLVDDADQDTTRVRLTARRCVTRLARHRVPLRLLVVDHLHILRLGDADREDIAIANAVRDLKRIAVDMSLHVLVPAQFSRDVAKQGRKPKLSDLRGAAAIEQIADKVVLIHRPWMDREDKTSAAAQAEKNAAELIVAKNRKGKLGAVNARFDGDAFRFDEEGEA